jgi:hypothetical protein
MHVSKTNLLFLFSAATFLVSGVYVSGRSIPAVGLAIDVFGAILLWRFGLPSEFKKGGRSAQTEWDVTHNPIQEREYKTAAFLSHAGIASIVVGFALQFVGTVYPKLTF